MMTIIEAWVEWLQTEDGKSVAEREGDVNRRDAWLAFQAGVDAGKEIEREEIGKRILRNVLQ